MISAFIINSLLIACAVVIHYEMLRLLSLIIPRLRIKHRLRVIFGVFGIICAHIIEIWMFGIATFFMLTYGDGVADIDIKSLYDFHLSHGKTATITGVSPPSRFGHLNVENDKVIKFDEKPSGLEDDFINGGFFVLNKNVFKYLNDDDECTFEQKPLENMSNDGELMVYTHKGFWQCMDTYRDMTYLEKLWKSGNAPWI